MPAEKLPPLVATGSIIGTVRPEVAHEFGLGADVKVVTGTPDLHSAAIGTAPPNPAGRTPDQHDVLDLDAGKAQEDRRDPLDCDHPRTRRDRLSVADNQEAAGLCLRWLREALPERAGLGFEDLTELAATALPGSGACCSRR